MKIFKKLFGYCWRHGWFKYPYRYRANTRYIHEQLNYEVGCHLCEQESNEYWADAWSNLYECGPKGNVIARKEWLCKLLNLINIKPNSKKVSNIFD